MSDREISADDGDQVSAKEAYENYIARENLRSAGSVAVTPRECRDAGLKVEPDPKTGHDSHVHITSHDLTRGEVETAADLLKVHANNRGWQYQPDPSLQREANGARYR